ncbi:hypothetical protein F4859DRAFT_70144 [Xylaria cf. heliscus]|nr:hypothetical protein F4859DRAFT_70144 [Xylaria cf. heliscus]
MKTSRNNQHIMAFQPSILETMRRGPITLVSATYGTDGQLHQNVISGPKLTFLCLPEEGLYILSQNRGLQIASACDRRKCYITQVCCCTEQQQHPVHGHMTTTTTTMNTRTEERSAAHLAKRFVQDRALSWLNFYEAADEIRALRLCFLAHPRTLSWDNIFDNVAFHFDSELEEHYASTHSYRCMPRGITKLAKECPRGLLDFVGNAWREFLDRGDHDFRPAMAVPEQEDDEDGEDLAYDGDVDDMSEWDDADAPIHMSGYGHAPLITPSINHKKRPRPEDDFDFIDDLIDEEFPRLKKTMLEPQQQKQPAGEIMKPTSRDRSGNTHRASSTPKKPDIASSNTKTSNNSSSNHRTATATAANTPHEEPLAPVIIPPKNMLIGRGLSGCSAFSEQQGFGNYGSGYGRLGQPARPVLRVASPC